MDDLSSKLGSLLSDPSIMEQISSLAGILGSEATPQSPPQPPAPQSPPSAQSGAGLPTGLSMPDPQMLGMMMKLAPLLGAMNEENNSTRLLHALRPFLSEKRQSRLDSTVRLLGLLRLLPMIREMGLF